MTNSSPDSPVHAAKGAIIRLAKERLALEAQEGALLVFDTLALVGKCVRLTNERSNGGGFTRMLERLAKMVGAPAPVQLLEVQRYYAIDLASARVGDEPLDTSELDFAVLP